MRTNLLIAVFAAGLAAGSVAGVHGAEAQDAVASAVDARQPQAPKELSGMSVLGNSEAPKSLVIVPWKTSEIGDGIGVSNMLDGRAHPVDKEVFARELDYYRLRTGSMPRLPDSAAVSALDAESGR